MFPAFWFRLFERHKFKASTLASKAKPASNDFKKGRRLHLKHGKEA
jgi:hypothetical protein